MVTVFYKRGTHALHGPVAATTEVLIAPLNQLDAPTEDFEPNADWEPWLAAPEGYPCQAPWCRGCDNDREHSGGEKGEPDTQEIRP